MFNAASPALVGFNGFTQRPSQQQPDRIIGIELSMTTPSPIISFGTPNAGGCYKRQQLLRARRFVFFFFANFHTNTEGSNQTKTKTIAVAGCIYRKWPAKYPEPTRNPDSDPSEMDQRREDRSVEQTYSGRGAWRACRWA